MLLHEAVSAAFGAVIALLLIPFLEALTFGSPSQGAMAIFLRAAWGAGAGMLWHWEKPL